MVLPRSLLAQVHLKVVIPRHKCPSPCPSLRHMRQIDRSCALRRRQSADAQPTSSLHAQTYACSPVDGLYHINVCRRIRYIRWIHHKLLGVDERSPAKQGRSSGSRKGARRRARRRTSASVQAWATAGWRAPRRKTASWCGAGSLHLRDASPSRERLAAPSRCSTETFPRDRLRLIPMFSRNAEI